MRRLDSATTRKICDCLVATINPTKIVVFGSYASGDASDASDIDIAAITSQEKATRSNLVNSRVALRSALKGTGLAIDFILQSTEQFEAARHYKGSIQESIATDGMVIYERN